MFLLHHSNGLLRAITRELSGSFNGFPSDHGTINRKTPLYIYLSGSLQLFQDLFHQGIGNQASPVQAITAILQSCGQ